MSRKIDACFFCTTPYQIIASIFIVKQLKIKADLYIINQFSYADQCYENIRKEKIYDKVRVIDEQQYKYRGNRGKFKPLIWGKSTLNYLRIDKIGMQVLIKDTDYDQMFSSSKNLIAELISLYFQRHGEQTNSLIFDDGVGSYTKSEILSASFGNRLIQRVTLGEADTVQVEPDFLYSPELYYKINGDTRKKIQKIQNQFQDKDMLEILNRVFQVQDSDVIYEKAILLDLLKGRDFNPGELDKIDKIYQQIFDVFGEENIMVKRHPRDVEPEKNGVKYYSNNQIPFECICMNMNCNNKVLLSVASTAVITPKLLMEQEPYVILLYKLIWPHSWNEQKFEQTNSFFQTFMGMYEQSEKFMIPETMEEFLSCLKNCKWSDVVG